MTPHTRPPTRSVVLLALLALVACSDLLAPFLPDGRVALDPLPPEYEAWWAMVETCSEHRADLGDVRWWTLPDQDSLPNGSGGTYYLVGNEIGLAGNAVREGYLVRHEMLHAVLARNGWTTSHAKEFFERHCGGVVSCGGDCGREIGGVPAEARFAPSIKPTDVDVEAFVFPSVMKQGATSSACPSILVGSRFTGTGTVTMSRPDLQSFGWFIEGGGGGAGSGPIPPNDTVLMEAGDVRWSAYDCPDLLSYLTPGEYVLRGTWNGKRSPGVAWQVVP